MESSCTFVHERPAVATARDSPVAATGMRGTCRTAHQPTGPELAGQPADPLANAIMRSLPDPFDQAAPADQGAGEADETVVDVEAAFPAHGEPTELVQQAKLCSTTYRSLPRPLMLGVFGLAMIGSVPRSRPA